jgi:hypothetical protein
MQLVFAALATTVMLSLIVSHTALHPDAFRDSPWVLLATTAASVAAAILILQRCDRVSNRYCGPTYRMVETLKAIHCGEHHWSRTEQATFSRWRGSVTSFSSRPRLRLRLPPMSLRGPLGRGSSGR